MAKAVYVAGGQSSLAKKVGVTQGAVWKWVRGIKKVSPVHAVA
ncbi:YdaS family helix-turn-helix protein, partial [Enterobacter hormaechei]